MIIFIQIYILFRTTSSAAAAGSATAASMNYRQLEEAINKWTLELEEQEKVFLNQATQVNAWDRMLMDNGEKIVKLHESVEKVKLDQQVIFAHLFVFLQISFSSLLTWRTSGWNMSWTSLKANNLNWMKYCVHWKLLFPTHLPLMRSVNASTAWQKTLTLNCKEWVMTCERSLST